MRARIGTLAALFLVCGSQLVARSAQDFQVRLLTPVASYSQAGTPFEAKVLGPVPPEERWTLPPGTIVRGIVRKAKTVGLGLKRERATLELEFSGCEAPDGKAFECEATLVSVDNARETVKSNNRIQGILAASNPYSWLNGIWYRPTSEFFERSPAGLTGAGGMIQSRLLPTPVGTALILGLRLVLLRLPDPEIALPSGTDLILRISVEEDAMASQTSLSPESPLSEEFAQWLRRVSPEISQTDHTPAADLINVALFSTKDQMVRGFGAAGWSQAEPLNAKTFARTYAAFAAMRSYPNAPVSSLYYQGRLPDLEFQKSFNSLAKRHHIRLWEVQSAEGPIWLGASTHDTAIAFDWKHMTMTHRIDSKIDRERSIVMNDLSEARCLTGEQSVSRPELQTALQTSNLVITDGKLAVGTVRNCDQVDQSLPVLVRPRRAVLARLVRRVILETRYYFTRGNAYYWTYQTVRWGISSWRKPGSGDE